VFILIRIIGWFDNAKLLNIVTYSYTITCWYISLSN